MVWDQHLTAEPEGPTLISRTASHLRIQLMRSWHTTQDGLPVGLQIVGRQLDDASVLAASAAFECLRPWQET